MNHVFSSPTISSRQQKLYTPTKFSSKMTVKVQGLKVQRAQGIWRCRWLQGTGTLNEIGSALKRNPKTNVLGKRGYWEGESQRTLRQSKEKRGKRG